MALSRVTQLLPRTVRQCIGMPCTSPMKALQKDVSCALQRYMSEGRHINIKSSQFEWTRYKDDLHLYIMLGIIPIGAVVLFANVFIGPAELAEIPEGYEPKHWEYQKGPIQRWFARYVYDPPEKAYEKYVHYLHHENEKRKLRMLEHQVKQMIKEEGDYKGWYFIPADTHKLAVDKAAAESKYDQYGSSS